MTKCPVCDFEEFLADAGGDLSYCIKCDHYFQTDLTPTIDYNEKYITDYFAHNSLRQMSLLRTGFVVGSCKGESIVDVGYGSGDFLRVMSKLGWRTFGCDVHGLNLGIKELPLLEAITSEPDVVTFFDSLEHFSTFEDIKRINSKYIVVSIPSRPNTFPENRTWKHYKPGEHLHYFSITSLQNLFSKYVPINICEIEDVVRGKLEGMPNIKTYTFERYKK